MKILYYTNVPSPYKVLFLNELSKNNEITTIYNGNEGTKRDKKWYNDNKPLYNEIYLNKIPYFQIKKILKNHYDAIIVAGYANIVGAILITLLDIKKIPFYIHADGGFIDENENIIAKKIKSHFISKAKYYLSSGRKTTEYFVYYGANINNIFYYPFTSLLKKDILKTPIKYEDKVILRNSMGYGYKRLFVSVGSFIKIKGYDLFFKALNACHLENTGFLIIGGGKEKRNYLNLINKYKLNNIHLLDFCDKNEVFNYLKMSDVFFFPSRRDIWGLAINEAMACGLPVISSDKVIAAIELIDKKYIFPVYDTLKQSQQIIYMANLTNNELYEIGKTNLQNIKSYSIEKMSFQYEKIILSNLCR